MESVRFIDLFAGIGGIRLGFEQALAENGLSGECVMTSEIKKSAIKVLKENHPDEEVRGDIRLIDTSDIPDFDFLLGGFPCQAFSRAGNKGGFADTRGTMFFEIERILKAKRPAGFLLENVDGLVNHDPKQGCRIGNTMAVILSILDGLGYNVSWRVLDSADFGVAQYRKRVYITGLRDDLADDRTMFRLLCNFHSKRKNLGDILESGCETSDSEIVRKLLSKFSVEYLEGKQLCDKRGGADNIHSWDILDTTDEEKEFCDMLLHKRRKKEWAVESGIEWMDGMPLTIGQIMTFWKKDGLEEMLEHLVSIGVLKKDYPKRLVNVNGIMKRVKDESLEMGYNIVSLKFRYELYRILAKDRPTQTLVASDASRLFVSDGNGLRRLTHRECLRLFGYPEDFKFTVSDKEAYDLVGNSVTVPVIKAVSERLLKAYLKNA